MWLWRTKSRCLAGASPLAWSGSAALFGGRSPHRPRSSPSCSATFSNRSSPALRVTSGSTRPVGRSSATSPAGPARFQRWTDTQVAAAGSLLRAFHDATRGSRLAGRHPVVCHHDPGPNNTVFANDVPAAFIDFDSAAPGDPLEDLGYMAWTWCISSKPDAPPATAQAAQVRILADAYRLDSAARPRLIDAALDRQTRNAHWWCSHLAGPPPHVADDHKIVERIRWSEREHAYTSANRAIFEVPLA